MVSHPSPNWPAAAIARWGSIPLCLLAVVIWLALIAQAERDQLRALVGLSVFAAAAFLTGSLISALPHRARVFGHVDAAAAGAMFAGAFVLVMPHAVLDHAGPGVLGLLVGLGAGATLHYIGTGRSGRFMLLALFGHSVCAGVAIGALYTQVPTLGWAAGIALLAHKAPAGYMLARRLQSERLHAILVVLPALGTGLGALSIAIIRPTASVPTGVIAGVAAGLFVSVALAFFAPGIVEQRRGAAEWAAFVFGGSIVVLTSLITPHGI